MNIFKTATLCLAMSLSAQIAAAGEWTLNAGLSDLAFGSVKKETIGETHHIRFASGMVSPEGNVEITLDLSSVDTGIDIRNERMVKFVFDNMPTATVSGQVDMKALEGLAVGAQMPLDVTATLSFLGKDVAVDTPVVAVRLSDTQAMVVTDGFFWLDTEELGVDAGVDKLQELAELPSITRAVPVAFRLVFDMHM